MARQPRLTVAFPLLVLVTACAPVESDAPVERPKGKSRKPRQTDSSIRPTRSPAATTPPASKGPGHRVASRHPPASSIAKRSTPVTVPSASPQPAAPLRQPAAVRPICDQRRRPSRRAQRRSPTIASSMTSRRKTR